MNGSILTAMPNGQPILVNCPNGQQHLVAAAATGSPVLTNGGRGLPALLMPSAHHLTPSHVLTCASPSTATTVITPNPPGLLGAANCPMSFTYYNPRMGNAGVVQLPAAAAGAMAQAQQQQQQQQQANGVIAQANGRVPQQQQQQPQHQMSVVLGRRSDLTRPPPSKWLACCCCLLPLWYANCNIYRVIALICNMFVDLLMVLCLLSTNWLTTTKYRQGLWQYCIEVGSPRPLPFGITDHDGCHWGRDVAYIRLSGFFAVACFVLAVIATFLTSVGLSSRDPNKKYTFYRFALYINLAALLAIIVSLTLYPAFFYSELHHTNAVPSNRPHWYFGWAYGVGWGSAIFLVGAVLLLVCDKETEEIYYKERTIVHAGHPHHHHQHQQQHNHNMHQHNGKA